MKTMSLRIGAFVLFIPSPCPLWEASSYVVGQLAKPLLQPLALSAGNQVLLLCFNAYTYNQETQHDISLNHPMNIWKSGQRWRLMMFGLGKHHETSSCCGVSLYTSTIHSQFACMTTVKSPPGHCSSDTRCVLATFGRYLQPLRWCNLSYFVNLFLHVYCANRDSSASWLPGQGAAASAACEVKVWFWEKSQ